MTGRTWADGRLRQGAATVPRAMVSYLPSPADVLCAAVRTAVSSQQEHRTTTGRSTAQVDQRSSVKYQKCLTTAGRATVLCAFVGAVMALARPALAAENNKSI